ALDRPVAADLVRPDARSRLREVVGEVLGRARLVGAVDRSDVRVGEIHSGVVCCDGRVVPLLDLLREDVRQGVRGQLEAVDARDVVNDRNGRDVVGYLHDVVRAATRALGARQLVRVECCVRAGEGDAAGGELLASATGPDRVVGDRDAGVRRLET